LIPLNTSTWQEEIATAVTDPAELLNLLNLPISLLPAARKAAQRFGLKVPRNVIKLMQPSNINDPLLQQILPIDKELLDTPGFDDDPVGDQIAVTIPGVLNKYPKRTLLIVTSACAIHCRYCMRKEFPYTKHHITTHSWQAIVTYIQQNTNINEIILSGGDPLTLSDRRLHELITALAKISHLQRLRIHTRLPILIPQRITHQLLQILQQTRLTTSIVVHVNHPNELALNTVTAMQRLRDVVTILNQSVLLQGINDNVDTLVTLSERLFDAGVLPYYIHLLDRVRGTAHFEVTLPVAKVLIESMRQQLPGYLVPRLVREEPGTMAKSVIV
jgi:EF-P beta-lysylation protein EpmB